MRGPQAAQLFLILTIDKVVKINRITNKSAANPPRKFAPSKRTALFVNRLLIFPVGKSNEISRPAGRDQPARLERVRGAAPEPVFRLRARERVFTTARRFPRLRRESPNLPYCLPVSRSC